MASAALEAVRVDGGLVVTKYGHSQGPLPGPDILEAGHPVAEKYGLKLSPRARDLLARPLPAALAENVSYHALRRIGDLIATGPTGAKVNDLSVGLYRPPEKTESGEDRKVLSAFYAVFNEAGPG